jgi:hypothetical protein
VAEILSFLGLCPNFMLFNILNIEFLGNSLGAGSDASISELIFCKKVGKKNFILFLI